MEYQLTILLMMQLQCYQGSCNLIVQQQYNFYSVLDHHQNAIEQIPSKVILESVHYHKGMIFNLSVIHDFMPLKYKILLLIHV